MAEKRKPEDNHEDDSNRPNKAQKPDEAEGNKSPAEEEPKSLAELEKEAKIAREKMTSANKRLSKTRRDQNKMLREEGLLGKRSRRRKTAPEPDYAELVKAKHEQKLKQNKSKRKGTRAAESCCRCQHKKAKCSDGPGPCTSCTLDEQPCKMYCKTTGEIYERGEIMRLKNDLQRLREERDAYRRELMRLGHADILDPQNSLPEDVQQDTSEAGIQSGQNSPPNTLTGGSGIDNGAAPQNTQNLGQATQGHGGQQAAPQYQQGVQFQQFQYAQPIGFPQNPYQPVPQPQAQHSFQFFGQNQGSQQQAPQYELPVQYPPQQPRYQQHQPQQQQPTQPQPLVSMQQPPDTIMTTNPPMQPFGREVLAQQQGMLAQGTSAPTVPRQDNTQAYDGADLYGDGDSEGDDGGNGNGNDGEDDAHYDFEEDDGSAAAGGNNSNEPQIQGQGLPPEDQRLADLLSRANVGRTQGQGQQHSEPSQPPNDYVNPEDLGR